MSDPHSARVREKIDSLLALSGLLSLHSEGLRQWSQGTHIELDWEATIEAQRKVLTEMKERPAGNVAAPTTNANDTHYLARDEKPRTPDTYTEIGMQYERRPGATEDRLKWVITF